MKNKGIKKIALGFIFLAAIIASGCSSGRSDSSAAADSKSSVQFTADSTSATASKNAPETADKVQVAGLSDKNKGASAVPGNAEATSTSSGFSNPDAVNGLNLKLIYKANYVMKVENYGKSQSAIRDLISLSGGYIVQFTENTTDHEQGGSFVVKVPAKGFSSFLSGLENVPKLSIQKNIQGEDVSEEYVDLESRLKAKQVTEVRYLDFITKANKTSDLVAYTNELSKIQEEIEQIKGRMRYIDQNVAFSTVNIRLYQPLDPKEGVKAGENNPSLLKRAANAMEDSYHLISALLQGLVIFLAAALPILLTAALIGIPVWAMIRAVNKRQRKDAEQARLMWLESNRLQSAESGERTAPTTPDQDRKDK